VLVRCGRAARLEDVIITMAVKENDLTLLTPSELRVPTSGVEKAKETGTTSQQDRCKRIETFIPSMLVHNDENSSFLITTPCDASWKMLNAASEVEMDGQRSREALANFLDYLADKGLMERNTAQSRKFAASKILGILEEEEAADVTIVDVDDVVGRFGRLHGKEYTPQSLNTYKSRLRSALDDFRSFLSNPLAFRPAVQPRTRQKPRLAKEDAAESAAAERRPEPTRQASLTFPASDNILPIPIRADLTVRIQGLPFDLTLGEAQKIAAVVTAMAQTQPPPTRG
jgi:hypothetical protein